MSIQSFLMEPFGSNCYLLSHAGYAVVVDPGGDPGPILAALREQDLVLDAIILTHLHYDHIVGAPALARASGAPIWASAADAFLRDSELGGRGPAGSPSVEPFEYEDLRPGRLTLLGQPCLVLDTPGHTPGGLSLLFPLAGSVFTGDVLFKGGCGRADLAGGDDAALKRSVRERLFSLPDDTDIFPGHGPPSRVDVERAKNPHFRHPE